MAKRSDRQYNRIKILKRDRYTCQYCGDSGWVIDHIIPYSFSKDSSENNLVACCQECNYLASDLVFNSFSDKRTYLIAKLQGSDRGDLVITRGRFVKNLCYCADCKQIFRPVIRGATHILCTHCAINADTLEKPVKSKVNVDAIRRILGIKGRRRFNR